ncbi:MAG: T9SS type A sorting domain-containing protein [Dysgonamonadaceae bacterium]|jgi:hypothetical protein|nr:T9SS type A sorting domain-containing protein [Dysgonamonadaceae bacterium]
MMKKQFALGIILFFCSINIVAQRYKIDVNVGVYSKHHNIEDNSRYEVKVYNTNGTLLFTCGKQIGQKEKKWGYYSHTTTVTGAIGEVTCYGWHRDDPDWEKPYTVGNGGDSFNFSINNCCKTTRMKGYFMGGNCVENSYVDVTITPIDVNAFFQEAGSNSFVSGQTGKLHNNESVSIKATEGYPYGFYSNWEYRISSDGYESSYMSVPSHLKSGNDLNFTGVQLLGNDFFKYLLNGRVEVRLNYGCGYSMPVILNLELVAPKIVRSEVIDQGCSGIGDVKIALELDRGLYSGEAITIRSKSVSEQGEYMDDCSIELDGNRCIVSGNFNGEYLFKLSGTYQDASMSSAAATLSMLPEHSCTVSVLPPPPLEFTGNPVTTDQICAGGNDGSISITAKGGSSRQYMIKCIHEDGSIYESELTPTPVSEGEEAEISITGLKSGYYDIYLFDAKGCEGIEMAVAEIVEPDYPLVIENEEIFNPTANGKNNGFVRITVSGGAEPYHLVVEKSGQPYQELDGISPEEGGESLILIKDLSPGEYFVELFDGSGCSLTSEFTIKDPPPIFIDITETAHINCGGEHTGALHANVTGGYTPYKYEWYHESGYYEYKVGTDSPDLTAIPAGKYRLKITDNQGNVIWTESFEQTEESRITATFSNSSLRCRGDHDGELEVSFSGGSGPYTYEWLTGNPDHTGLTISDLSAGDYSIRITDDLGCTITETGYVAEPDPLNFNPVVTNPSCFGMENGTITMYMSGGTAPYNYFWSNGVSGGENRIISLSAGDYDVTVEDTYGCEQVFKAFTLVAPTELKVTQGASRPASFEKKDGYISIYITGGAVPYTVRWYDEANKQIFTTSLVKESNELYLAKANNLSAGIYNVVVTDANYVNQAAYSSCKIEQRIDVSEIPPLAVIITETQPITCHGYNDGKLEAVIMGGLPFESGDPYLYVWYKNDVNMGVGSLSLNDLNPGNYKIKVKDDNNTEIVSSVFVLREPDILTYTLNVNSLTCHADSSGWIRIDTQGGTTPYSYEWDSGETVEALDNLTAGTYPFVVIDARGCYTIGSAVVEEPDSMDAEITIKMPSCYGDTNGRIDLVVSGGTTPYNYLWGEEDPVLSSYLDNIGSGTYDVKVMDENGCNFKKRIEIPQRTQPRIRLKEKKDPLAFGGNDGHILIEISEGESPYKIFWTNEFGELIYEAEATSGTDPVIHLYGISKGRYFLRIEDVNTPDNLNPGEICGCVDTTSFYIDEPPLLEVFLSEKQQVSCFGVNDGVLSVSAQGGVPNTSGVPYIFRWYRDDMLVGIKDDVLLVTGAGKYRVVVIDANGVEATSEYYELGEPDPLKLTFTAADLKCSQDANAWAEVSVSGGIAPYTYDWSTGSQETRINQISRGVYFVHVKDFKACEVTGNVRVVQPDSIRVTAELIPPACYNSSDGQIRLELSGGQAPYTYSWENNSGSLVRTGLRAGSYTFSIVDANGCGNEIETYELSQPDSVMVDLGEDRLLCGNQSHELTARSSEPYSSCVWYNNSGKVISNEETTTLYDAGIYRARVVTAKGCRGEGTITIRREGTTIAADFAVATQVPVNEEVTIVNISIPDPDRVEWILPEDYQPIVIDSSFYKLELIFPDCGTYIIGMKTYSGECYETSFKTITVMNREEIPDLEQGEGTFLKSFSASPNPTRGIVKVVLELRDRSDAELLLINSGTGRIIEKRALRNQSAYLETFQISESSGVYILLLNTSKGRQFTKIIKQ